MIRSMNEFISLYESERAKAIVPIHEVDLPDFFKILLYIK